MPRTFFLAAAIAGLAALVSITACRSKPSGSDGFRTIAIGYDTGIAGEKLRTARNNTQWTQLWREHTSTTLPTAEMPTIDFSKEMVVCVLAGEKPTAGYGIEVVDAQFNGKAMVLGTRATSPAEGAIVPQIVTRPYHMIAAPMTSASFRIEPR